LQQLGEHRHERGRQRRLREQVAEQVGYLRRERECRIGGGRAEESGTRNFAREPGDARERRGEREDRRVDGDPPPGRLGRRRLSWRRRAGRLGRLRAVPARGLGIDLGQGGYSRAAPRRNARGVSRPPAMANIKSQKKRIARAERERLENRRYTSKIKTFFRRLERAVADGDGAQADAEHRELVQAIDKAVKRGALHRNAGARKKSRAARLRRG
jgi:small subunit ribosomal protein S20